MGDFLTASLIWDAALAALILFVVIRSVRGGFVSSFIHLLGVAASCIVAALTAGKAAAWLYDGYLAERVEQSVSDSLREKLEAHRELYDIGLHGPDLLFYYHAEKSTPVAALGNAMHDIGKDGIFILRAFRCSEGVRVEVEDHGPGIAAADLPYIFDRYYRSRSDAGKQGTGLGLSIATEIVQRHNGTLSLVDREGPGTTVRLELPIIQPLGGEAAHE